MSATTLAWNLDLLSEPVARDLADRESSCCSSVSFSVHVSDGVSLLDVEAPPAHVAVLDALAERAAGGIRP